MTWEDVFELVCVNESGACCRIGGDPEMDARYPKGYQIRNKTTGVMNNHVSMTKYTAEHYASELFKEMHNDVERLLLHN